MSKTKNEPDHDENAMIQFGGEWLPAEDVRKKMDTTTLVVDAIDRFNVVDECGEIRVLSVMHRPAIGVNVLANQFNFTDILRRKDCRFCNNIIERPADLFTPGLGNDTE